MNYWLNKEKPRYELIVDAILLYCLTTLTREECLERVGLKDESSV